MIAKTLLPNSRSRMRVLLKSFLREDSGQVLPIAGFMLIAFLGMSAVALDMGHAVLLQDQLQNSADAAAMAAAQSLPQTTATTMADSYSSISGDYNANATQLAGATMASGYPKLLCLTTLKNMGMACTAPANANAVQVAEQVVVHMPFGAFFGHATMALTATSTAAMRGASATPYNVIILLDTTASMSDTDSDSQCNSSRLSCAETGIQTLLQSLSPCASSLTTCGTVTSGNVVNSVDRVSIFTFPNVTVGTASQEYDCSSTNPTAVPYTFPSTTATTYAPSGSSTGTYQITTFSSDYRSSDSSTSLSATSNLTLSVGGKSGCVGMGDPGGEGTYYAGAIYAAQAALLAEQAANPGSQNVIILLSDGDASASSAQMASGASTTSGVYPSTKNQCSQAITAAKAATAAGTRVYAVAYGAESSGCSTDTSGTYAGTTPCQTMQNIASATQYFFSDYTQSGSSSSCISSSQPTSNLNQIFTEIASDMTVARLIPNNTT
jgi:Flp pilus assembly protein TadG